VEPFLIIATIIALLCVSALCIFLITVLVRVKQVLNTLETDMKEMTTRAIPIMENMDFITTRVRSITESIDDQVMIVRESIGAIRDVADNVVALERKVQERIEGPILDTVSFVAAVLKGVRTFFERVRA
jgi:uncharacterized protein YoxC